MKNLLCFCWLLTAVYVNGQSHQLAVRSGYGSGLFNTADTVHVWAENNGENRVFDHWACNGAYVADSAEWHTTMVMPDKDLEVTAVFREIELPVLQFEEIMGAERPKAVFWAFPDAFKAVVTCHHGTGGNAENWAKGTEYRQFVNDLLADSFAVIITEAEEVTLQTDLNNDGGLRWSYYPLEPDKNTDIKNIMVLLDTFRLRGMIGPTTPCFSAGMSNGGGFAPVVAYSLGFKGTAVYCAGGSDFFFKLTSVPTLWNMQQFDTHENVGPEGNEQAKELSRTMLDRGICSGYNLNDRSPVYRERFLRDGYMSANVAQEVYGELKFRQLLDDKDYLIYSPAKTDSIMRSRPADFTVYNSLPAWQQYLVMGHLGNCYADHHFFSDYNRRTIRFFKSFCQSTPATIAGETSPGRVFPNPVKEKLYLDNKLPVKVTITDASGRVYYHADIPAHTPVSVQELNPGLYFLLGASGEGLKKFKFIKE